MDWAGTPIQPYQTNVLYADGHVTAQGGRDYWFACRNLDPTLYNTSKGFRDLALTVLPYCEKNP